MVASTITIETIYLDCRERFALSGGVSSLEDDTVVHVSDSRTVATNERSERALQNWQLTWIDAYQEADGARFLWDLFRVCRNSKGFLFISPLQEERVGTGQIVRNTVTGGLVGDGSTTTFQLQYAVEIDRDIGAGSATSGYTDVNYPLQDTVVAYKNGVVATLSSVNLTTGVITFSTAPGVGVVPSADFERAIPVMFTSKSIARTLLEGERSEVRSAQIKEIL